MLKLRICVIVLIFSKINFASNFALPFEGIYKLDILHFNDFHARNEPMKANGTVPTKKQIVHRKPARWRHQRGNYVGKLVEQRRKRKCYLILKLSVRFEETSVDTPTCRFNNGFCLGGFARLYSEIMRLRKEKPHSLLLNAGDSFQGTYWYALLKWNVTQEFMNLLPHDAHAIGNHDFDDGPEGLAPYISALDAPVVAANMDSSEEPLLNNLCQPHIIITRRGRRIGVIGLITPNTKLLSFTGKVKFTDPHEATRREAKQLSEKGVDIIVLLSHCGYDDDIALARQHGEYVDVIVGGHSHRDESFEIPYVTIVEINNDKKNQVIVVQAYAFTKVLGNLSVYFDIKGNVMGWDGGPIFLNRSIPEDERIKQKLEPYAKLVHQAEQMPVGVSTTELQQYECGFGECKVGNLLVDALNYWAKEAKDIKYDCIAFVQRSNINARIPKGQITKGSIIELFPYYDFVETFELQGKHVLQALERSVSDAVSLKPFEAPWLLQVSGLRVIYNISQPEGQRVQSVTIGDFRKDLDSDNIYQVTAPSYLAGGADGYAIFKSGKQNVKIIGHDQILLERYIKNFSPINVVTEGRIIFTK